MIQALPLVEAADLSTEQLALACASHNGAAIHRAKVTGWLSDLGLGEADLRCGPQMPDDWEERERLIRADEAPCQVHNNCSGKHTGFLMLGQRLGGGPDYVEPDHPVQRAVRTTFEEVTGEASPGYGIDGCSAPNFATSLAGLGRAMAAFASAQEDSVRGRAMVRLRNAMTRHPDLVAGEGRACTELMQAMGGRVAVKTGAEAVFVAIVPEHGVGIAIKIHDGGTRASECAVTAILCGLGLLDPEHPAARKRMNTIERNRRGIEVGTVRPGDEMVVSI
jgi:L-asparaginase II